MIIDNTIKTADLLFGNAGQKAALHDQGAKRALQIRRALEDRAEVRRLRRLLDDPYWEAI